MSMFCALFVASTPLEARCPAKGFRKAKKTMLYLLKAHAGFIMLLTLFKQSKWTGRFIADSYCALSEDGRGGIEKVAVDTVSFSYHTLNRLALGIGASLLYDLWNTELKEMHFWEDRTICVDREGRWRDCE